MTKCWKIQFPRECKGATHTCLFTRNAKRSVALASKKLLERPGECGVSVGIELVAGQAAE